MSTQFPDDLMHHGIKGMRWGVRKSSSGQSTNSPPKNLSDEELKRAVERMRLEQQYKDLASGRTAQKSAGKKFAEQALTETGKQVIRAIAASTITLASAAIGMHYKNLKDKKNKSA